MVGDALPQRPCVASHERETSAVACGTVRQVTTRHGCECMLRGGPQQGTGVSAAGLVVCDSGAKQGCTAPRDCPPKARQQSH